MVGVTAIVLANVIGERHVLSFFGIGKVGQRSDLRSAARC
jgi:hypothetical protein